MLELTELEGAILRVQRNWWIDCSGFEVCDICPANGHEDCHGIESPSCPVNSLKTKIGF